MKISSLAFLCREVLETILEKQEPELYCHDIFFSSVVTDKYRLSLSAQWA